MTNKEVVQLEVQLDTSNFEKEITEAIALLEGWEKISKNVGNAVNDSFSFDDSGLQTILTNIGDMAADLDVVATKMREVVSLMTPQEETWFDGVVEDFNSLADARVNLEEITTDISKGLKYVSENEGTTFNLFTALFPKTQEMTTQIKKSFEDINWEDIKSSIPNFWDSIKTKILGDDNSLGDSVKNVWQSFLTVCSDAGQKMRDFGGAIGTAFSKFGATIAQLASSTGVWIANTAAKVGNTAAQWAQVAATTAWQAICTAATAVTTAFGAAMNFLASPIGLVVIAIVALIAIIVLLIANWDTVKEAVLTAWEAITGALATAAEWFNTNVIQPFVGFFTMMIDWISTKLQEGMAFVQGIFAGMSEFLQGMFAKDWTEQFGAFGNVLNAFFANVENVWNAVKDIFNGIVSFVKNVFAGDWGAAWDSIVSVFKGIWDYLVAIVKAPINIIIGLINGLVQGVVDGINLVIGALNGISFDIPDWVPLIGGQTFGFNLTPLMAPKIPLLAKGAVLPANRPFLAMVGDQRHGTNVEAPLTTIQEAVAQVMENQFSGMMAGFEASVAVQKQILHAVLGIEVGDTTIGQAANRYNRRMAIIKGGM